MAIQPVDLQLAYLAAPQSAAVASVAQQGPAAAQAASQAAFVNQLQKREETVTESPRVEGAKIQPDADGPREGGTYSPRKRRRAYQAATDAPGEIAVEAVDEQHFIDTTA